MERDLSKLKLEIAYLVLDGIWFGVRAWTREKEAVLVAWAFLEDGSRELVGVTIGNSESYSSWKYFLENFTKRGMREPMLTVTDGCPGALSRRCAKSSLKRTNSGVRSTGQTTCWIKCWKMTRPQ